MSTQEDKLRDIADAIRDKDGTSDPIPAPDFPDRIRAIQSGGVQLETIAVTAPPAKTAYRAGESFDPAGMVVTATYSNGATLAATGYAVEPAGPLADGTTEVTVRYTEGGVSAMATVAVTVAPRLAGLRITAPPGKTAYRWGESFDASGMAVEAVYSDGSAKAVSGYTAGPETFAALGDQEVTVRYSEDGDTVTAVVPVTVGRAVIAAAPTQSGTPVYNGGVLSPEWSGLDPAQLTLGGTVSAINAGTYTAEVTPTPYYEWPDGSTGTRTVSWTIAEAAGSLSLSTNAVTLNASAPTQTVTAIRAGDGAVSAVSSDTSVATVEVSGTAITIRSVGQASGSAVVTVSVGKGTNHTAPAAKTVSVTAQFVTIYGVEWDWTNSGPTRGTRTDAAANFPDPSPAVNNGTGSSPFDNLMPWAGMVKETRAGGVEVREPKYWFKWTKTGKKLKLQIAGEPVEGFLVDPVNMDRGDGLGELEHAYIGRYHCVPSTYKSETNKAQQVSINRSAARTSIHKLGGNFWQIDFAQFWYISMLILVEFADWDIRKKIGKGSNGNGVKVNNGYTDAMQYHTGTTAANRDTYGFIQYRNIEGWWDVVLDWIDGCYYNYNGLNIILNPNQFSDNANGTLVGKPKVGCPSDFAIPTQSGLEWALYPCETSGSTTTHDPDSWLYGDQLTCLIHGGLPHNIQSRGAFLIHCLGTGISNAMVGCRLQERPPKTV